MSQSDAVPHERLPGNVEPSAYDIHVSIDLEAFRFSGHEQITLRVVEHTETITFHAKGLTIPQSSVVLRLPDAAGTAITATGLEFSADGEACTVRLARPVDPKECATAQLEMDFEAPLGDTLCGLYRAPYDATNPATGTKTRRYMAVTQFEATDARRAFPCWDEPERKAAFTLSLDVDAALTALSNMPVASVTEHGAGRKTVCFAPTPVMSTYLLAFVVGEFDSVAAHTAHGVEVRVYTPCGKSALGRFALDVGVWALDFYTEYFGIGFPLPKCDMVAITDFDAGAMENWGLVTYREAALLIDEAASSSQARQRVATTVTHELAHQWFGNLVTMKWWNDLWLNEGFATYMETYSAAARFPQWDFWATFLMQDFFDALMMDAKPSTHAIDVHVARTSEIGEIFDAISYSKGAALIRMLATHLGSNRFRDGLRVYLQRHRGGNTTTADLWAALREVSGVDVAHIMHGWTQRPGFPLVRVRRDPATGAISLAQERMFSVPSNNSSSSNDSDDDNVWWIPLRFDGSREELRSCALEMTAPSVSLPGVVVGAGDWLKVNAGQTALVHVLYEDPALFAAACRAAQSKAMGAADRLGLEFDAFALSRAGYVKLSDALGLALCLDGEDDPTVIRDLAFNLASVRALFGGRDDDAALAAAVDRLIVRVFAKTAARDGWAALPGQDDLREQARAAVLQRLVLAGDAATVEAALALFERSLADAAALPCELRRPVYCAAARFGSDAQWAALRDVYRRAEMSELRVEILRVVGCVRTAARAAEVLEWARASGDVLKQDFWLAVASVAQWHPATAWAFLRRNWDWFWTSFNGMQFLFGRVIGVVVSAFADVAALDEFRAFFADKDVAAAEAQIEQAYDDVRAAARWRLQSQKDDIGAWLAVHC